MANLIQGMAVIPKGTEGNILMQIAFVDMVRWAIQDENIKADYKARTGKDIDTVLKATGINAMIDKATGYEGAAIAAFADWLAREFW